MLEWIWCVLCGIFLARGRRNEKGEDLRSWVLIDDASDGGWRWRGVSRRSWDMQWRWRGVSRGKIWSCGVRRWGRRGCLEWTLILIRVLTWLGKSWVYFLRAPPPPIFNLCTFMKEINTWLEWFLNPKCHLTFVLLCAPPKLLILYPMFSFGLVLAHSIFYLLHSHFYCTHLIHYMHLTLLMHPHILVFHFYPF